MHSGNDDSNLGVPSVMQITPNLVLNWIWHHFIGQSADRRLLLRSVRDSPQAKDYAEAASLAFELRQPRRLLAVVSAAAVPVMGADAASASASSGTHGAAAGAGLAVHPSLVHYLDLQSMRHSGRDGLPGITCPPLKGS